MLKKHIVLLICCTIATYVYSQNETTDKETSKKTGLQIGINATYGFLLLTNIFNDYGLTDLNINYLVFAKYKFLRLQVGTNFNGKFDESEEPTIYSEPSNSEFRIKLGAEHDFMLNQKLNFFAGGSIIYHHTNIKQRRTFNLQYGEDIINYTDIEQLFGPGLHCGIEWLFAKNVSFSTEASFHYLIEKETHKESSEIFPDELGIESTIYGYQSAYQFPFLNFLLRFKL